MMNICFVTATRAEYGINKTLLKKMNAETEINLKIVVTGTHLVEEYGNTYKEIIDDGFIIDRKIDILLNGQSRSCTAKTMGLALISFSDYLSETKPDLILLDGDRYEILAIAMCAVMHKIPIAHLGGGAVTEGAIDDSIRHALTKLSNLHFTTCEKHAKRLEQMGEDKKFIYNVGSPGVENLKLTKILTKKELEAELNLSLDNPYILVTLHPETNNIMSPQEQIKIVLKACERVKGFNFIFTKANSDYGGKLINSEIDKFVNEHRENCIVFASLGAKRYLSAVKYAKVVLGNSSSGIIEVPSLKVPTINIGDRQKGRIQASSIYNCCFNVNEILKVLTKLCDSEFRLEEVINPYDGGNTSEKILNILKKYGKEHNKNITKKFVDIYF